MRHFAIALILATAPVAAFAAPTFVNGSFESPNVSTTNGGVDYMEFDGNNGSATTGWTFTTGMVSGNATGYAGIANNASGFFASPAPGGTQAAFIQNNSNFSQTITGLTVGDTYVVSFYDANRSATNLNPFTVTFGGVNLGTFTPSGTTFAQQLSGAYTATATSGLLSFAGTVTSGDMSNGIDLVTITDTTAVPEPASLLLLAGGLAGVGLFRRAQRQRAV